MTSWGQLLDGAEVVRVRRREVLSQVMGTGAWNGWKYGILPCIVLAVVGTCIGAPLLNCFKGGSTRLWLLAPRKGFYGYLCPSTSS